MKWRFAALVSAVLATAPCASAAAQGSVPTVIGLEQQVLQFVPSRPDLSVGIVWLTILSPDQDWTVRLAKAQIANFQDAGTYKYLELKRVGDNRFELPSLKIEPASKGAGTVCLSVKAWFSEVASESDSLYWIDMADRYALLSFCTKDDERAQARHSQNRVATLEEFRARLAKPFAINARSDLVPWRPAIFVDHEGALYFHSLLIGRHTPGTLSHHRLEGWKLSPDRKLDRIAISIPPTRPAWSERMRDMAREPFDTLLRIAATDIVARGPAGNLYVASPSCRDEVAPLTEVAKIDASGECRTIASPAQLHNITALAAGPAGALYITDGAPGTASAIRRLAPDGTVSTLAADFHLPSALTVDAAGNVHVAEPLDGRVQKVTADGVVTTVSAASGDPLVRPTGVAVGPDGSLYILDSGPRRVRIRKIPPRGKVQTLVVIDAPADAGPAR